MSVVVIAVLCSVLGSVALIGIYKLIRIAIRYSKNGYTTIQQESKKKPASAISGNFVHDFDETVPITNNYRLTRLFLGRGSSAEVYVGEHRLNYHRYAIKIIDLSKRDVRWKYERERDLLKDIEHSNIIRLFEVYYTPTQMFFVMELCTGGHLGHFLKRQPNQLLPELQAREFILQITRAIMHCHEHGICHRDIKLQNILLENNSPDAQVKIVDFGNAVRFLGCTPLKKVVGTTYTAAPEVFRQHYDERCDVWSLGVVAYILLSGRRPFERLELDRTSATKTPLPPLAAPVLPTAATAILPPLSTEAIQQALPKSYRKNAEGTVIASILLGRYHFHHEAFQTISREAIYFLKACMEGDYQQRPHARELLSHPWLRNDFLLYQSLQRSPTATANTTTGNNRGGTRNTIVNRRLFSFPVISPSGVKTLVDSSQRHLQNPLQTGMRDTSMLAIAFTMPVAKIKQIRNLFQEIDRNGNGLLEKEEFRVAMLQVQSELSAVDIEVLFDCMDQNGDGNISFLEFVAAMIDPRTIDIREMNQAFKLLDQEQKGYLTKEDFLRVLYTADTVLLTEEECLELKHLSLMELQTVNPQQYFQERIQQRYIPPITTSTTSSSNYTSHNNTSSNNINNSKNVIMGRMTMIEFEKEWLKEFQRQKQLRERVEQLFTMADVNGDGQLSYSEFLFAMAEGSLQLGDFITPPEPRTAIQANTAGMTSNNNSSKQPQLAINTSSNNNASNSNSNSNLLPSRRQTEGNVKRIQYRFKLRTPTFRRSTRHSPKGSTTITTLTTTRTNPHRPVSSYWSWLTSSWSSSSLSTPSTRSPAKIQPETQIPRLLEDLYVSDPKELKLKGCEGLDLLEYLEDSPLGGGGVTRRGGRREGGRGGGSKGSRDEEESSSNTSTNMMNNTTLHPGLSSVMMRSKLVGAMTANKASSIVASSNSTQPWMSGDIENQLDSTNEPSSVALTPLLQTGSGEKKNKKMKPQKAKMTLFPPPMLSSQHRAITSPALLSHDYGPSTNLTTTTTITTSQSSKSGKKVVSFDRNHHHHHHNGGGKERLHTAFVASSSSSSSENEECEPRTNYTKTKQEEEQEEEEEEDLKVITAPFESPIVRHRPPRLTTTNAYDRIRTEADRMGRDDSKEEEEDHDKGNDEKHHQKDDEVLSAASHFLSHMQIEPEESDDDDDEKEEEATGEVYRSQRASSSSHVALPLSLSGSELDEYLASQMTLPVETELVL